MGENKVIAGMLYEASRRPWTEIMTRVRRMTDKEKGEVICEYLRGRTQRWQKAGRAFENVYNRFEIAMNIGAWRDLHRHRMLTQQRQRFSCHHGYDLSPEIGSRVLAMNSALLSRRWRIFLPLLKRAIRSSLNTV